MYPMLHHKDTERSHEPFETKWGDGELVFELRVSRLGTVIVATDYDLDDPLGKLTPRGLAIRTLSEDRGDGS